MCGLRDGPLPDGPPPGFTLDLLSAVSLLCTTPLHGLEISQLLWVGIGGVGIGIVAWFGVDLLCTSIVMGDEPPLETPPHPAQPPPVTSNALGPHALRLTRPRRAPEAPAPRSRDLADAQEVSHSDLDARTRSSVRSC